MPPYQSLYANKGIESTFNWISPLIGSDLQKKADLRKRILQAPLEPESTNKILFLRATSVGRPGEQKAKVQFKFAVTSLSMWGFLSSSQA